MQISLRPHHLLCLKGYKGLNYSNSHKTSWNLISNLLKEYPDSDILIVKGKDDLCKKCPAQILNNKSNCRENSVDSLDQNVKKLIGVVTNRVYKYSDIVNNLNKKMTYERHKQWCSFCAWWKKGLCHDSFK